MEQEDHLDYQVQKEKLVSMVYQDSRVEMGDQECQDHQDPLVDQEVLR